jgi:hypothetical protein
MIKSTAAKNIFIYGDDNNITSESSESTSPILILG